MEIIKYKGIEIEIKIDECGIDPRGDDNLSTINCFHQRYNIGESHDFEDYLELKKHLFNEEKKGNLIYLPIYIYDHSGITISTTPFSCGWDSGQIGYIYVTREKIKEWFGEDKRTDEQIKEYLIGDLKTYDQYLKGEMYWYNIEEIDENCSGFFGDEHKTNGLLDYAQNAIDCYLKDKLKDRMKLLKAFIKNSVPLSIRQTKLSII